MTKRQCILFFQCVLFSILLSYSLNSASSTIIEGNPNGKVTLVDFFDYQCPHCQRMAITLNQLISQDSDVRVVYKVVPVLDQISWILARAALAAQYQPHALKFHHELLSSSSIRTQEQLAFLAQKAGLNPELILHDIDKPAVTAELQRNLAELKAMQVAGVPLLLVGRTSANKPTFLFKGEVLRNVLQQAIQQLE